MLHYLTDQEGDARHWPPRRRQLLRARLAVEQRLWWLSSAIPRTRSRTSRRPGTVLWPDLAEPDREGKQPARPLPRDAPRPSGYITDKPIPRRAVQMSSKRIHVVPHGG